jgi:hypothetical protein
MSSTSFDLENCVFWITITAKNPKEMVEELAEEDKEVRDPMTSTLREEHGGGVIGVTNLRVRFYASISLPGQVNISMTRGKYDS